MSLMAASANFSFRDHSETCADDSKRTDSTEQAQDRCNLSQRTLSKEGTTTSLSDRSCPNETSEAFHSPSPSPPPTSLSNGSPIMISGRSRRQRPQQMPEFLRKNPILFRKAPKKSLLRKGETLTDTRIIQACNVDTPDQVKRAVLSGDNLVRVVRRDLLRFHSLVYLDLGDNNIPLSYLGGLPALEELHLHCNGIRDVQIEEGAFPCLSVLGLGYNALSVEAIAALSTIPKLRELDLACNEISQLPDTMSSFIKLQKLSLRRNRLFKDSSVSILGSIPNLQILDISENAIKRVPAMLLRLGSNFSSLLFIDISYNYISTEESLLALAGFSSLEMADVRGNPFLRRLETGERLEEAYVQLYNNLVLPCDIQLILEDPKADYLNDQSNILVPLDSDANLEDSPHKTMREYKVSSSIPVNVERSAIQSQENHKDLTFLTSMTESCKEDNSVFTKTDQPRSNINHSLLDDTDMSNAYLDELNSGQFTDHSTLDVNRAMGMLRYALKHPLVCHKQANARHYEKSTLSRNLYTKSKRAERQARQDTIDETKRADMTEKKASMHNLAMDAGDSYAELSRGSPAEHALGRLLNSRRWKLPPSMAALDLKLEKGWKTHARDNISKSSTISQASNPKAQRPSLRAQQSHQHSFARRSRAERNAQPRRPNRLRSAEEVHVEPLQNSEYEDVLRIVQNVLAQNS